MNDLNLVLENVKNQDLTVRQGEALPLVKNRPFDSTVIISSVHDYIKARKSLEMFDEDNCIVSFSIENGTISLMENFKTEEIGKINGVMIINPLLVKFGINREKRFSNKELLKLIKQNRNVFPDKQQCFDLLNKLSKFSAKIETIIEDENNNRGKEKKLIEKEATTDIPEGFDIKLPLFIGEKDSQIFVEIYYECNSSSVSFYLESIDCMEQLEDIKKESLNREIQKIDSITAIPIIQT